MGAFEKINMVRKKDMVRIWKEMKMEDKDYFVDQVALALSIWGTDEKGKVLVAEVLGTLIEDGSENLSDFGLYIEEYLVKNKKESRKGKMERASGIINRYRLKNALSSVPHKEIEL
ncbi:hypothetical protein GF415_02345 [Candidatus Micrarchaeota archaeon]|nr:hypothetical protein [Candidatus Micrarchaeota archaeon]